MASGYRSFLKSTTIYSFLAFLPLASRFVLLPIFLLYLAPREFGIIGLSTAISSALPIFFTLGFDHAFSLYFFHYNKNKTLLHTYISTVFLTVLLISTILFLLILPWGPEIYKLAFKDPTFTFYPYGLISTVVAIFTSINSIIVIYLRNSQKPMLFLLFSGGSFFLSIITETIAVIFFKAKAADILTIRMSVMALVSIVTWTIILKKYGLRFEKRFLKSSLSYSLPIIPYVFFAFIYMNYDRIMIENYLNLESVAVYNLAASVAIIVDTVLNSLQNTTTPLVYEKLKQNYKTNEPYVSRIYRGMGLTVFVAIGAICLAAPFLILNLLKPIYASALTILPILLIGYIFRYLYTAYVDPLFFFKKTKQLPWLNVLAGSLTILLNIWLLPRLGLWGAAISMLVSRMAQLMLTYYWYTKASDFRYKLRYIHQLTIVISVLLLAIAIIYALFPEQKLLLYISYAAPIVYLIVFMVGILKQKTTFKFLFSKEGIKQVKDII